MPTLSKGFEEASGLVNPPHRARFHSLAHVLRCRHQLDD